MGMFLKCLKMYSVSNLSVLHLEDNFKQEITKFISEAMKNGLIKPVKRCVINSEDENFTKK